MRREREQKKNNRNSDLPIRRVVRACPCTDIGLIRHRGWRCGYVEGPKSAVPSWEQEWTRGYRSGCDPRGCHWWCHPGGFASRSPCGSRADSGARSASRAKYCAVSSTAAPRLLPFLPQRIFRPSIVLPPWIPTTNWYRGGVPPSSFDPSAGNDGVGVDHGSPTLPRRWPPKRKKRGMRRRGRRGGGDWDELRRDALVSPKSAPNRRSRGERRRRRRRPSTKLPRDWRDRTKQLPWCTYFL